MEINEKKKINIDNCREKLSQCDIVYNEQLAKHTTFRIGGPAAAFARIHSIDELRSVISYCIAESINYYVLGNGSNVLADDGGYAGMIIQIYDSMNKINISGEEIYAEAGALLSKLAAVARENELTGFEFAAGIPGTLGGAVVMNAGAYGGEMKNVIEYVDIMDTNGNIQRYTCEEMQFGYRHSIADAEKIVVGAGIRLLKGSREKIIARMNELKEARVSKQPLEYPSAGSTFKRPQGYFAGKLIQDSGLSGYRVGGAMVSTKHCGFVINYENATSEDVKTLIDNVSQKVYDKFGVRLEPEVKLLG